MPSLLVIDDDPVILDMYNRVFTAPEYRLRKARSGREAIQRFNEDRPDVVLLDFHLPDMTGLELFQQLRPLDARVPMILITGYGTAETAIEAMRLGAYDYLVKPVDLEQLEDVVAGACEISRLMRVPAVLGSPLVSSETGDLLIGQSEPMREVYKAIGRIAPQDVPTLITGETGTGKELVARAIYHYSRRARSPFLAINCSAFPETLLESELFGHEKGAFNAAERKRIGKFEQCQGGTLFLDEIGDMTPLTQAKLLRVLQSQEFERVGGNQIIRTNVRVIAATNRDLPRLMREGKFRTDLYYRLSGFTIALIPLRERLSDVPLLAQHFLSRFAQELGKDIREIPPETIQLLQAYSWPGNVREFQSVLRQAILASTGPILLPSFLPETILIPASGAHAATANDTLAGVIRFVRGRLQAGSDRLHEEVLNLVERQLFLEVLRFTNGNQSQASRILGITRPTLRTKLALFGINASLASR